MNIEYGYVRVSTKDQHEDRPVYQKHGCFKFSVTLHRPNGNSAVNDYLQGMPPGNLKSITRLFFTGFL